MSGNPDWNPTKIQRVIRKFATSTSPVLVETDAGEGYLKAMGNPIGPHVLACELVGTKLAARMGIPTFDFSVIQVQEDDLIPLADGRQALPGPAFITRAEKGTPWGGGKKSLRKILNREDIPKLVMLDTWTLNNDRFFPDPNYPRVNRDNVFLSFDEEIQGWRLLKAIDQGHCFSQGRELTPKLANISNIKDPRIYGLFHDFRSMVKPFDLRLEALKISTITKDAVREIVQSIPREWEVNADTRKALVELIYQRENYLRDNIINSWNSLPQQQEEIDLQDGEGEIS